MKGKFLCAAVAAGLVAGPAVAGEMVLTGKLRDFKVDHVDMQYETKAFGVKTGLVEEYLGADGKPVLSSSHVQGQGMIDGAASFDQWFRDVPDVNIAVDYPITLVNSDASRPDTGDPKQSDSEQSQTRSGDRGQPGLRREHGKIAGQGRAVGRGRMGVQIAVVRGHRATVRRRAASG